MLLYHQNLLKSSFVLSDLSEAYNGFLAGLYFFSIYTRAGKVDFSGVRGASVLLEGRG